MLSAIRNFAKSWPARILLAILAISFVGWGINKGGSTAMSGDWVVKAGSRTITALDFRRDYGNYKERLEEQRGGQRITPEEAEAGRLDRMVLDSVATNASFAEVLSKMGLRPSDKLLLDQIGKISAFFDPITGRFDKKVFESKLAERGLTPEAFDSQLRDDVAVQHWAVAVQNGLAAPRAYGALAAIFAMETRDLSYLVVTPADITVPAPPTDAQLTAFINENKAQLTIPEMRVLTLVAFTPQSAAADLGPIDPAELKKQFDFRKDSLSRPETRTIIQVPVKTAASAEAVAARLRKGEAPEVVAKSLGVDAVRFDNKPRTAIADRKVADAAFRMVAGQVGPVQGDLGLSVVEIIAVDPGHQITLEEARPVLEAEIRKDMVAEKVYAVTAAYEAARDSGAGLVDAAQKAGATTQTLGPITSEGQDARGGRLEGLPPKILETAFGLPAGAESEVTDLGDGASFAVKVDRVQPPRVPSLNEIRPLIARAWMQREMLKAIEARAEALTVRIQKGETLEAVAASLGRPVAKVPGLTRRTAQQHEALGRDLLARAFGARPGDTWSARMPQGIAVGRVDNVRMDAGPAAAQAAESQRAQLSADLFREMGASAQAYSRAKLKTKVNVDRARAAIGLEPLPKETKEKGAAEKKK
jgi:peptidyl-prolyl cis-trans isomerase D